MRLKVRNTQLEIAARYRPQRFCRVACTLVTATAQALCLYASLAASANSSDSFSDVTPAALSSLRGSIAIDVAIRRNRDLWIAGLEHVHRYDGSEVQTFALPGLPSSQLPVALISGVYVDRLDRVLVVTSDGSVFQFNDSKSSFVRSFDNPRNTSAVTSSAYSKLHGLWVGYQDGGCEHVLEDFKRLEAPCGHFNSPISDIAFRDDSVFLLGSSGVVSELTLSLGSPYVQHQIKCELPDLRFTELLALPKGRFLIGSGGQGVFACGVDSEDLEDLEDLEDSEDSEASDAVKLVNGIGESRLTVHDIALSIDQSKIRVSSDAGLFLVPIGAIESGYSPKIAAPISTEELTSSVEDHDGRIWTSSFAGVKVLHPSSLRLIERFPETESPAIIAISDYDAKGLVVADYSGLYLTREQTDLRSELSSSSVFLPIDGGVTSVTEFGELIVVGLRSGGITIVPSDFSKAEMPVVEPLFASELGPVSWLQQAAPGLLFIGTFGAGLFEYDGHDLRRIVYGSDQPSPAQQRILFTYEVEGNGLLIGTEAGLFASATSKRGRNFLDEVINAVGNLVPWTVSARDGFLWLATPKAGVFRFEIPSATHGERERQVSHYRPGLFIQSVIAAQSGSAFVATPTGIFYLDRNGGTSPAFEGASIGLLRFDYGAAFRGAGDRIYFGGTGGLAFFDTESYSSSSTSPVVHLLRYNIDGSSHRLHAIGERSKRLQLRFGEQKLSIGYGVLGPTLSGTPKFRYLLAGFDNGWVKAGRSTEATYTSLPPGNYEFEVQASNPDGSWNENGARIPVTVLPPWWLTWWAIAAYIACALFLLWLARKYYENVVVTRRANELATEMSATAEMAMEDLQEQLETQGALLRELTARNIDTLSWIGDVLGRQAESLPDPASAELAFGSTTRVRAFISLEHALRFEGDQVFADLRAFTDDCCAMLAEEFAPSSVAVINEVDDGLIAGHDAARLATVIHELLANAFAHAFGDRNAPGNYVSVALTLVRECDTATRAELRVQDNGSGMSDGDGRSALSGTGFDLVEEVAGAYGGTVEYDQRAGTLIRVTLTLPPGAVL